MQLARRKLLLLGSSKPICARQDAPSPGLMITRACIKVPAPALPLPRETHSTTRRSITPIVAFTPSTRKVSRREDQSTRAATKNNISPQIGTSLKTEAGSTA